MGRLGPQQPRKGHRGEWAGRLRKYGYLTAQQISAFSIVELIEIRLGSFRGALEGGGGVALQGRSIKRVLCRTLCSYVSGFRGQLPSDGGSI